MMQYAHCYNTDIYIEMKKNFPYVRFAVKYCIVDASQDHKVTITTPPKWIGTRDLENGSKTVPTIYRVISPKKKKNDYGGKK